MEKSEAIYDIVFEGGLADGRTPDDVQAALEKHYGAAVAKKILASDRIVLKKDAPGSAAKKAQQQLLGMGLVTRLVMTKAPEAQLSLEGEDAPAAARPAPASSGMSRDINPPPADDGSLTGGAAIAAAAAKQRHPSQIRAKPRPRTADEMKPKPPYSLATIDDSFTGDVEVSASVSRGYTAHMVIVAFLMILLPIIYLGLVALIGYATYWHTVYNIGWVGGDLAYLKLMAYLSIVIGGLMLTLFMFKPFVARDATRRPQPVRLDPRREPAVFHLVDRITEALGAPEPVVIHVDAEVNASASLRRGIFSNELRLTIGMPLFYGMRIEDLTGVLAHEFGHFAQRFGMRFAAVIHYINYWLYHQAFEEDSWDEWIEELSESENAIVTLSALVAGLGSVATRIVLVGLFFLATILSRGLSRQMEFDADRYEIELCGSKSYLNNARIIRILAAGHQSATDLAAKGLEPGRLPDNLPALTRASAKSFSEAERNKIVAGIEEVNASVFDTHPPDLQRIEAAKKLGRKGVFSNKDPAFKLLREPERLANHVTMQWYRSYGVDIQPDALLRSEDFAAELAPNLKF